MNGAGTLTSLPSRADSRSRPRVGGLFKLENATLWLFALSGGLAIIEPSPYEAMFCVAAVIFAITGLRLHASTMPMLVALALFNIGGLFALLPFFDEPRSVQFVFISLYLGITAVFFAMLMRERTLERVTAIKGGTIWAGAIASTAGILGYFDVAGLGSIFSLYSRASGTFKDPNVLGAFVVLPLVWLAQDILLKRGWLPLKIALFGLIFFGGSFLSFSRGAWANAVVSIGLMVLLTYIAAGPGPLRRRIIGFCVIGAAALVAALLFALSFEQVRTMFEMRASVVQDYDAGVTGRFGNQLRAIPELMELPNGYGPLRFRFHFPEDPHNVYVNAFASYGWLGGFSYLALAVMTVVVGWRVVFVRSNWQPHAIAIWSVLFIQIVQGLQIDTDHWRHWYMMLGMMWGFAAAAYAMGVFAAPKKRPSL